MSFQTEGSPRVQNNSGQNFRSNVGGQNGANSGSSSDSETDSESDISEGRGTREQSLESETSYRSLDVEKMMEAMLCSNCELIVIPSKESVFCESGHYLCRSCQKQDGGTLCPVTDPEGVKCNKDGNRSTLSCGGFPLYNAIFLASNFKCKFASLGCKTIVTSVTMKNHHNECDFRPNEDCIFSDCGKYLSSAFSEHYDDHRVKTFSQNALWIKVLYDRPEKISLNEKLRWVSCILECFNNTFFLTVERHGGNWMVWMYALYDHENLDKFEVHLKLRSKDSNESSLSNSAVLDIHSRSVPSEKIRKSKKYWKLSEEKMLPNLYPYGQKSTGTKLRYLIFNIVILEKSKGDEKAEPDERTEPEKGAAPTKVEIIQVPVLETLVEVKNDSSTSGEQMTEPDAMVYVAERELEEEDGVKTSNGDEILENVVSMSADDNQEMNDAKQYSGDADAVSSVPATLEDFQENVSSARTDDESISSIIAQFLLPAVDKTETEVDSCTELAHICSQHQPLENTGDGNKVMVVSETPEIKVDDKGAATEEEEDEIFEDSISDENAVNLSRNDEIPAPIATPQASEEGKYSWRGIISGGLKVLKAWIPVPIESGYPSTPVNPEESQG